MPDKYDSVIIGGGISGMSSAILLAQEGRRVALVEQSRSLAPLIDSFQRNGYRFEPGFHFSGSLGESGVLSVLLRLIGVYDKLAFTGFNDEAVYTIRFPRHDRFARIPGELETARDSLSEQYPDDARGIHEYFAAIDRIILATPTIDPLRSPQQFIQTRYDELSLYDFVAELQVSPAAESMLLRQGTRLYGVAPKLTPFRFHAMLMATMYPGLRRVLGGGRALVRAFAERLDEVGVDVRLGCPAQSLIVGEGRRVRGVEVDGGEVLECNDCVAAIDPKLLVDLLPDGSVRPAYRRRLRELKESSSFFCVYLGLNRRPAALGRGVYEVAPEVGTDEMYDRGASPETCGFVVVGSDEETAHTAILMRYAGEGEFDRWADSELGSRPADYIEYKRQQAELLLERAKKELPDLDGAIEYWEASTPLSVTAYSRSPEGSAYGVAHRIDQRNPEIATRVNGLLLAGQGILAPGVCGAAISSFYACSFLLGGSKLRERFRECL